MYCNQSFIIAFYCLIGVTISQAMETKSKINACTVEEIFKVKDLQQVRYIRNDSILINTLHKCSIVDLKTKDELVLEENNNRISRIFLIVHGERIIADVGDKVMIFNMQTHAKTYIERSVLRIALDPSTDRIFLADRHAGYCPVKSNKIIPYNYSTGSCQDAIELERDFTHMAIHPKKAIMCIAHYSGKLSFHALDNLRTPIKTLIIGKTQKYYFCSYSNNGSYIVAGNNEVIHIINSSETDSYYSIYAKKDGYFPSIALHPDEITLAILVRQGMPQGILQTFIDYWNLKTKRYIDTVKVDCDYSKDFSFSPDGLQVIVACEDKYMRTSVPFAVRAVIKKKCSYVLFLLQQLRDQDKLPQDIVQYCIQILWGHLSC